MHVDMRFFCHENSFLLMLKHKFIPRLPSLLTLGKTSSTRI